MRWSSFLFCGSDGDYTTGKNLEALHPNLSMSRSKVFKKVNGGTILEYLPKCKERWLVLAVSACFRSQRKARIRRRLPLDFLLPTGVEVSQGTIPSDKPEQGAETHLLAHRGRKRIRRCRLRRIKAEMGTKANPGRHVFVIDSGRMLTKLQSRLNIREQFNL